MQRINQNETTKINELVSKLLGNKGNYIGVTATPARLNLNNTFDNKSETWVRFYPHNTYTGQDAFFPQSGKPPYRRPLLSAQVPPPMPKRARPIPCRGGVPKYEGDRQWQTGGEL